MAMDMNMLCWLIYNAEMLWERDAGKVLKEAC